METDKDITKYEQANLLAMATGSKEQQGEYMVMCYDAIDKTIRQYCELNEEYYPLINVWIMGTYMHNQFSSYPYLFFNAMKGSGKTRLLKLVASMSHNGKLVGSPSEAVLFRTAYNSTFCIDEFEGIGNRDKGALRELLNAAYKKGMFIERLKKVNTKGVESYVPEQFDVYCPIAMANIWGMEEVLADRCLKTTLEKSNNPILTRMMETEGFNGELRNFLSPLSVVSVSVGCSGEHIEWNDFLKNHYQEPTLITPTTPITQTTQTTQQHNNTYYTNIEMYEKIIQSNIKGRALELFFPLFLIANKISKFLFEDLLKLAIKIVKEKNQDDRDESKDVMLLEYLSIQNYSELNQIPILTLNKGFFDYVETGDDWINPVWLGRALKRLNLVIEKVRHGDGRKVRINFKKVREKLRMFKTDEE